MKLKYLGTAAAEGIPALFCNCKICQNALKKRGKEIKTRSQAILDDRILIDFPPDTYMHMLYENIDLKRIRTLIITHSHFDHLNEKDFWCRNEGIANQISEEPLHIYATSSAVQRIQQVIVTDMQGSNRIATHEITPFVPFEAEGYRFIPLKANHDPNADPVIYIIEKGEKTMLYANDTGVFPPETVAYLNQYDRRFDLISLDCTGMLQHYRNGHMSLDTDVEMYEMLKTAGRCDADTIVYLNHFSHNGYATHEELVAAAKNYDFHVSYDGCEVDF